MFKPIHKHILIRAHILKPVTSSEQGKKFLTNLVELIGMHPVTKPQSEYVGEEGNRGFTGSINLASSHIAFHIWDETGLLMMDVYSCKDFSTQDVVDYIDKELVFNREANDLSVIEIDRERIVSVNHSK